MNNDIGLVLTAKNKSSILLKILINYFKMISFLLSLKDLSEFNFSVNFDSFFPKLRLGADMLTQISPSADCLLMSIKIIKNDFTIYI